MFKKNNKVAKIKYIAVKKSKCYNKELKLSYRQLETIVEMGQDYLAIIEEKIKEIEEDNDYKLALFNYKKKEILKIVNYIAENIGYCKGCNKTKKNEEIGLDPFSAASVLKKNN